jgi:acetyl esterase/lipase
MRRNLLLAVLLVFTRMLSARPPEPLPTPDRVIPLYEGVAPGSENWNWTERTIFNPTVGLEFVQNVVQPTLLYYAPDPAKANGTAVIIAPGGGGVNLTIRYEGTRIATQLSRAGVAAFVLKYRLVAHPTDSPLSKAYPRDAHNIVLAGPQKGVDILPLAVADGATAVAWVRTHAGEFNGNPHRVGFVGFSAGGEIACALVAGAPATRPDFFAPIYGASADLVPAADAPPVFLAVAADDEWGVSGSLALFKAWRAAGRPAELHVFQTGGHGFLNKGGGGDQVIDRLEEWMRANGWLTRAK